MNDNEATVRAFFKVFGDEGVTAALRRYGADGVTWWVAGMGEMQDNLDQLLNVIGSHLTEPLKIVVRDVVASGDKVAVEAESNVRLKDGRVYNNHYHFKILLKSGKLAALKEYNDTKHAADIWGPVLATT